jgi:hypothetical protein
MHTRRHILTSEIAAESEMTGSLSWSSMARDYPSRLDSIRRVDTWHEFNNRAMQYTYNMRLVKVQTGTQPVS